MLFFKKLDTVRLEAAKRKGFEEGKEKMRELKDKEAKKTKASYLEIISKKNSTIKDKDKRVKEIEKNLQGMRDIIIRMNSFSQEIAFEHESIFMENAKKKAISERINHEADTIKRKFEKGYGKLNDMIEDYNVEVKIN